MSPDKFTKTKVRKSNVIIILSPFRFGMLVRSNWLYIIIINEGLNEDDCLEAGQ